MKDDHAPIGEIQHGREDRIDTSLAADRILSAAGALLRTRGAGEFSMQEIADAAGVSKGLIHYHFRDRDALFERLVLDLEATLTARLRTALDASTSVTAVDDLRQWLDAEIAGGDWRALLLLATWGSPDLRARVRGAKQALGAAAEDASARLHALLGLRSRLAPALVGQLLATAISGLVLLDETDAAIDADGVFDVLILAVIALAERPG